MNDIFSRQIALTGREAFDKLQNSTVCVLGAGGVGSYACEGLIRAGIGNLIIMDSDVVSASNINRQIIATVTTIGKPKVELIKKRALEINPDINVIARKVHIDETNISEMSENIDYVADAIDTISSKICVAAHCFNNNIPLICALGTGNKLGYEFKVCDLYQTHTDPIAKVMRKELKNRGVNKLKVVFSEEQSKNTVFAENGRNAPASISYPPGICGLVMAGEIIRDILGISVEC